MYIWVTNEEIGCNYIRKLMGVQADLRNMYVELQRLGI